MRGWEVFQDDLGRVPPVLVAPHHFSDSRATPDELGMPQGDTSAWGSLSHAVPLSLAMYSEGFLPAWLLWQKEGREGWMWLHAVLQIAVYQLQLMFEVRCRQEAVFLQSLD